MTVSTGTNTIPGTGERNIVARDKTVPVEIIDSMFQRCLPKKEDLGLEEVESSITKQCNRSKNDMRRGGKFRETGLIFF